MFESKRINTDKALDKIFSMKFVSKRYKEMDLLVMRRLIYKKKFFKKRYLEKKYGKHVCKNTYALFTKKRQFIDIERHLTLLLFSVIAIKI